MRHIQHPSSERDWTQDGAADDEQELETVSIGGLVAPGPLFVALDKDGNAVGCAPIECYTYLGGLAALSKVRADHPGAASYVAALATPLRDRSLDGTIVRLYTSETGAEHAWWTKLLMWGEEFGRTGSHV